MKSINPYNLQTVAEHKVDTNEEVVAKINLAQSTFLNYRHSSFAQRKAKMMAVAQVLRNKSAEYAQTLTLEMGKPIKESISEIEKCAWVCEYYAEHAEDFLKAEMIKTEADQSFVSYEPLGVILAVMPWNFPFWQVFRFAAPTLMAGNTAVLKHADNVQGAAQLIEDIFLEAGFDKGTFVNLAIEVPQVEAVLRNPIIKGASLTGSERAGAAVASVCGEEIKPTLLELGGSNAFIVLKDADIKAAAKLGMKSRMINNAQSCIAAKRFILEKEIAEDFIQAFKEELLALKSGDPMDEDTQVGPMARVDLAEGLEKQMKKSIEQGAVLVCGGKRTDAYFEPTILSGVKPGMVAFEEELFGPVSSMIIAQDADEAIELANASTFGLGMTIATSNVQKALELGSRAEDGAVFINELVKSDPRLPFGGTKKSGYGRELSRHGILEFVNAKTVYVKNKL
jgi:succinate-semialdehyde dehydrogenase/glutarate-semialdehyde dehydrogenase